MAALRVSGLKFGETALRNGLTRTNWPGRFQIVAGKPTLVLDGAHNADAATQLAATVRAHFPGKRVRLILGVLRDKNYDEMCRILAPLAAEIFCVPVNSERTSDPAVLAGLCRAACPHTPVSVVRDVAAAVGPDAEVILITGSLFLVGEAMERLGIAPRPATARELVLQ